MIYLLFSGFFAVSTFAQTTAPLLTLDQYSGYTLPQYAMEAHCILEPFLDTSSGTTVLTGHTLSKIFQDRTPTNGEWKTEINSEKILNPAEYAQALVWLKDAEAGPFKSGMNPSDIGTVIIKTPTYPLLFSKDGGKRVENLNKAAVSLIAWFRQACQLPERER